MQFKIISSLAALSAALLTVPAMAQTVTYQGYASTVSCTGSAFGCSDNGALCCVLPDGFGFSAQFNDLPSGSQGQGYANDGCTDFLFSVFGPGTQCATGSGIRSASLNWFHSPSGRRGINQARAAQSSGANCSQPISFTYELDNGERTIKVPDTTGAAQTIADLYLAKDLDALAAYGDF